jgi:hypothetical protein
MSKWHRRTDISKQVPPPAKGITTKLPPPSPLPERELPDLRKRSTRGEWMKWSAMYITILSLASALIGVLEYTDAWMRQTGPFGSAPTIVTPSGKPPPRAPRTEADQLIDRFMRLKNARAPAAEALLGPAPIVPDHPLHKAEAEALQAAYFLRDDLQIVEVRRASDLPAHQRGPGADTSYILVTKGNVAAPRLTIWKDDKEVEAESSQRTMSNPDIHVRVAGDKIVGLRPELHTDP